MIREVRWTGPATRDIGRLDQTTARRIRQAINRYAETGYGDVISLRGRQGERRLRVGQWRVLFRFDEDQESLMVLRVLPRGRAYR